MPAWIITNKDLTFPKNFSANIKQAGYSFSSDNPKIVIKDSKFSQWVMEGYLLPRKNEPEAYFKLKAEELADALFGKYGEQFVHHVKGNFTLIQLNQDGFKIYSDRFGIKKYFYWQRGKEFIISSELKEITKQINAQPSAENMAIYALTYHFTGGRTLFAGVMHNLPGQIIEYNDGTFKTSYYWRPEQLLNLSKIDVQINDISNSLIAVIESNIKLIDQNSISLSLTGGADTRNLLAVFMKLGVRPHLYTYGNPASADCSKARIIADGLSLEHEIYDIQMDEQIFEKYARKIIRSSGGLASIHRAHRLIAVEREKEVANAMFLGTLGGEYIKGVSEDDYIVPSIVYDNWDHEDLSEENIVNCLRNKFLKPEAIDIYSLRTFLIDQPFFKNDRTNRKLFALTHITAHLHDAQDVNLYETVMNRVYTPFLDIDYFELIFFSKYTFNNKEEIKNKYLKRIENPVYASEFLNIVYPELLKYEYAGEHKPSEVLFNKYYAAMVKQIRKKIRLEYPPNFPLGRWMEEFVRTELPTCHHYQILQDTFDLEGLQKELNNYRHIPKEAYWLKFTNPIMMKYILDEYS